MAPDMDDSERELEACRVERAQRTALYEAVTDTMHQGARRGIHAITACTPNEDDVGDVVYDAFCEFEKKNQDELRSPQGMAYQVAFQRGRDRGRKIIQQREQIDLVSKDRALLGDLEFREVDAQIAQRREALARTASECLPALPADQQSVVAATVMESTRLSDWALREGKSHQAASRQRTRALESLRRCVNRKRRSQQDGKEQK
jgi:DNA-directed RNA polymerase specialized sigma24 family protein